MGGSASMQALGPEFKSPDPVKKPVAATGSCNPSTMGGGTGGLWGLWLPSQLRVQEGSRTQESKAHGDRENSGFHAGYTCHVCTHIHK